MREGYLYVNLSEDGPLINARVGDRVARPQLGPPWFAVMHTIERLFVTGWPARLLRVAMLPASTPEEQANLDFAASGIRADAGYTRVLAVKVLEELPPFKVFGPHGENVAPIADAAAALTYDQAKRLARLRHREAAAARSRVWRRWLKSRREMQSYVEDDYSEVLDHDGSPIGHGINLLFGVVWKSAKQRGGPNAFKLDPEPEEEGDEILQQPWYDAAAALIDAAVAEGAPHLLENDEHDILCHAWRELSRPRKLTSLLLHEERTENSWRTLTARLTQEGDLRVEGQDLSRSMGEYEWAYSIKGANVSALRNALGAKETDDLLTLLSMRCTGREADRQLRALLTENGIEFGFWSRIDE